MSRQISFSIVILLMATAASANSGWGNRSHIFEWMDAQPPFLEIPEPEATSAERYRGQPLFAEQFKQLEHLLGTGLTQNVGRCGRLDKSREARIGVFGERQKDGFGITGAFVGYRC